MSRSKGDESLGKWVFWSCWHLKGFYLGGEREIEYFDLQAVKFVWAVSSKKALPDRWEYSGETEAGLEKPSMLSAMPNKVSSLPNRRKITNIPWTPYVVLIQFLSFSHTPCQGKHPKNALYNDSSKASQLPLSIPKSTRQSFCPAVGNSWKALWENSIHGVAASQADDQRGLPVPGMGSGEPAGGRGAPPALVRPHLQYQWLVWGLNQNKDAEQLGGV